MTMVRHFAVIEDENATVDCRLVMPPFSVQRDLSASPQEWRRSSSSRPAEIAGSNPATGNDGSRSGGRGSADDDRIAMTDGDRLADLDGRAGDLHAGGGVRGRSVARRHAHSSTATEAASEIATIFTWVVRSAATIVELFITAIFRGSSKHGVLLM